MVDFINYRHISRIKKEGIVLIIEFNLNSAKEFLFKIYRDKYIDFLRIIFIFILLFYYIFHLFF